MRSTCRRGIDRRLLLEHRDDAERHGDPGERRDGGGPSATPIGRFARRPRTSEHRSAASPCGSALRLRLRRRLGRRSCVRVRPSRLARASAFASLRDGATDHLVPSALERPDAEPRRCAPTSDDGRDDRTGGPPSRTVASIGLTRRRSERRAAGVERNARALLGRDLVERGEHALGRREALRRDRARARARRTPHRRTGIDGSIVRTSGASRMQMERITCS